MTPKVALLCSGNPTGCDLLLQKIRLEGKTLSHGVRQLNVQGLILIAIGVGTLMDVSVWPGVLIAIGASALLSVAFSGHREATRWFNCWQCWPTIYQPDPENPGNPRPKS